MYNTILNKKNNILIKQIYEGTTVKEIFRIKDIVFRSQVQLVHAFRIAVFFLPNTFTLNY